MNKTNQVMDIKYYKRKWKLYSLRNWGFHRALDGGCGRGGGRRGAGACGRT